MNGSARFKLLQSPTFCSTDVLVFSSNLRLGTRSPKGWLQPLGLLQACRESLATDGATPLVGTPSGSGNVSSHNALDWKYFEPFHHHAPVLELGNHFKGQALLESLRDIQGNVVSVKRGDLGLQQLEPELAKLGEHGTLLFDTLVVPT